MNNNDLSDLLDALKLFLWSVTFRDLDLETTLNGVLIPISTNKLAWNAETCNRKQETQLRCGRTHNRTIWTEFDMTYDVIIQWTDLTWAQNFQRLWNCYTERYWKFRHDPPPFTRVIREKLTWGVSDSLQVCIYEHYAEDLLTQAPLGEGQNLQPAPSWFSRITPKPLQISTQNLVYLILHHFDIECSNFVEIGLFLQIHVFVGTPYTSRQFWPKSARC